MGSKKMMLVLIATFALAAFVSAAIEKDVITADAINALSKSNKFPNEVINALSNTKTTVPNLFLAETFLKPNAAHTDASIPCGESCVFVPCFTKAIGCSCRSKVCYRG